MVKDDTAQAKKRPTSKATPAGRRALLLTGATALGSAGVAALATSLILGGGGSSPDSPASPAPTPGFYVDGKYVLNRLVADWADVDWDRTIDPVDFVEPLLPTEAPASFDDGLDSADLPGLVERPSPRYPDAHALTDEIWLSAGPDWGIAVFGATDTMDSYFGWTDEDLRGVQVTFYLVSPEGVCFKMWDATEQGRYSLVEYSIDFVIPELGWIKVYGGDVGDDPMWWSEVRDLRTGEVLTSAEWYEGVGSGTERMIVPGLEGGRILYFDILHDNGDTSATVPTAYVVEPSQEPVALALPNLDFSDASLSATEPGGRTVLLSRSESYSDPYLYSIDILDGTITDRTSLLGAAGVECFFEQPHDQDSFIVSCDAGERYVVGWDGTVEPAGTDTPEPDAVEEGPWEDAGFSVEVEHTPDDWMYGPGWSYVASFRDATAGSSRDVLSSDQCLGSPYYPIAGPFVLGGERFAFLCFDPGILAGYDRNTGEVFALVPDFWPDTGARSALSDFVLLPEGAAS